MRGGSRLFPSAPCPILQYADDTLVILKADEAQLLTLKQILQTFSRAQQCKVAWEDVCLPKDKGGLGVPDLVTKNKSLLKKFLFKFHCAPPAPWIDWLRLQYGWSDRRDFSDDIPDITPIWKEIYAQLPSFRAETKVLIGHGKMTAFWLDLWCGSQTLAVAFPALFSHVYKAKCLGCKNSIQPGFTNSPCGQG
jgi:hypothetical protein